MPKQSAGIVLFRRSGDDVEVLLGHPGGPFWAKKDDAAWSIPKGEVEAGEDLEAAARREFAEEMGSPVPEGELIGLGTVKISSGKVIHIWALEADFDVSSVKSNTFEMAWPPNSGNLQSFPEIDRAAWFTLSMALTKTHTGQSVFVERLAAMVNVELAHNDPGPPDAPVQASLF